MTDYSGTRRDVLRRWTATVGATAIIGTAGCTGLLGGDGDGGDGDGSGGDGGDGDGSGGDGGGGDGSGGDGGGGDGSSGDGGDGDGDEGSGEGSGDGGGGAADYARWAPEPGAIADAEHYRVRALRLESLGEHEDEFREGRWDFDSIEERWAASDVAWQDVELYLRFRGVSVLEGAFARSEVVEAYDDADYSEQSEYEGYTFMLGPREERVAAVGSDAVVFAGGGYKDFEEPADVVRTVVDTKAGEVNRYVETDEHFDELADVMGGGDVVNAFTRRPREADDSGSGPVANHVARGERWTVAGEQTQGTWGLVFETVDDLDVDDVEEWVRLNSDANGGEFGAWNDVELTVDGRTAVVEATADTDSI